MVACGMKSLARVLIIVVSLLGVVLFGGSGAYILAIVSGIFLLLAVVAK